MKKPGWVAVRDTLIVNCNYELLTDNLLDLTHVVFVHKTALGGSNVTDTPLEVSVDGDVVHAHRFMHNVDTAPIYKAARGYTGKIDRWQILEWYAPSYIKLTLGARETGTDVPVGTPVHRDAQCADAGDRDDYALFSGRRHATGASMIQKSMRSISI